MSNAVCRAARQPGKAGLRAVLAATAALLSLAAGCQRSKEGDTPRAEGQDKKAEPTRQLVKPQRKTVSRRIEQPGFNIEAFQETPLYARISDYVKEWKVDIGDRVEKDEVLAELDVPERVVAVKQKEAAIRQSVAQVKQAKAAVLTAEAQEARARRQYDRLTRVGQGGAIDRESVDEARLGHEAARAGVEKARSDVQAAEAHVEVAKADRDYAQTMLQPAGAGPGVREVDRRLGVVKLHRTTPTQAVAGSRGFAW